MKKFKFLAIAIICSVAMFACKSKPEFPENLVAVPKDASVVMSFNNKNIVDKSGLNHYKDFKFYSKIEEEINNSDKPEEVKKFLEDTRYSGLNLDDVFLYTTNDNGDLLVGLIFKIDDVKKFEKRLTENQVSFEDSGTFKFISKGGANMKWNDKILSIIYSKNEPSFDIFNTNVDASILSNADFKAEYKKDTDICFYANYGEIIEIIGKYANNIYESNLNTRDVNNMFNIMKDLYRGINCVGNFTDYKGKSVLTCTMTPKEAVDKMYEKINLLKDNFDESIYKYFPDSTFISYKASLNPAGIYQFVKDLYCDTTVFTVTTDDIVRMREYVKENDAQITEIVNYFKGDGLFSLYGISMTGAKFSVAVTINENATAKIEEFVQGKGNMTKNNEGYYSSSALGQTTMFFAIKGDVAYLTSDQEAMDKFVSGKGFSSDISSSKANKIFKDNLVAMYINLNMNDYPSMLKSAIAFGGGSSFMPILEKMNAFYAGGNKYNGTAVFETKDNDNYTSNTMLKLIDEVASNYLYSDYSDY